MRAFVPGSARVPRVGDCVPRSRILLKTVSARTRNQHPRRVRYPILVCAALIAIQSHAAEVIPPKPRNYFNDYAAVVSREAASRFAKQLAQFERETSNQVIVAVFPKMQSDDDIAAYTQRVAQAWGVGQKDKRNGVVLFIFIQDRKMFIQVGYGLEGALPDVTAFDITERRIKPHFRNKDYEGGIAEGIAAIFKAIRPEYKGDGSTVRERYQTEKPNMLFPNILLFFFFFMFLFFMSRITRTRGYHYSSGGGGWTSSVGGWGSSGGGWSSGGGDSGFSGGGGDFGGGGAGSSW